jgi:hypothetical protein
VYSRVYSNLTSQHQIIKGRVNWKLSNKKQESKIYFDGSIGAGLALLQMHN